MIDSEALERRVLLAFAANERDDPDGAWNAFHASIIEAAGNFSYADQICRDLRRRKFLKGEGRGQWSSYYLTDKGKAAVSNYVPNGGGE